MSPSACLNAFCPIAICYCFPALLNCYFAKLLLCCFAALLLCYFATLLLCMFNFAFLASSAESGFALSPPSSCTESAISATGQIQRRRRRRRKTELVDMFGIAAISTAPGLLSPTRRWSSSPTLFPRNALS